MDNLNMNRQLGTKWFTFYTKVRPWFACVTTLAVIADFMQYQDVYTSYWWMMVYLLAAIAQPVLAIIIFVKSQGDYENFVRFVNGVLLFETINMAYGQAVQQYIKNEFNIGVALIVGAIILMLGYFLWYRLNMKYFKKRIINQITNEYLPDELIVDDLQIRFCRKCGAKLLDNSQFCHKCGAKSIIESSAKEAPEKPKQITPIDKLVMLTVGLPAAFADKSEDELNIIKNQYTYCEAVIFAEFLIRANALEIAPSKDIAMKFSDTYIEAVIKETINTVPNTESFFADMFYARATLYDDIVMNSKEPIMEVVEVLAHIIHKELDDEAYISVDNKNYRYFGGILENLAIKTELVSLFEYINDCTSDAMQELKEYLKSLG